MKFKTKEELIKENTGDNYWRDCVDSHNDAIIDGINKAFKSFAERVEFYKKYKDLPEVLHKEYPKVWNNYVDYLDRYARCKSGGILVDLALNKELYMNWLFDYCFGDIK